MKFSFLLFFLCVNAICQASLRLEPCQFGLSGEFLYLTPQIDSQRIAREITTRTRASGETNRVEKDHFAEADFNPGFRVEGFWAFDPFYDLHLRFTYYNSPKNRHHLRGFFVQDATLFLEDELAEITYNRKYKLFNTELLLSYWLFDCDDFDFSLQGGLLYSNRKIVVNSFQTRIPPATPPFIQFQRRNDELKFWGVGPEFVFDFQYHLLACDWGLFSIAGDGRGALLATKRREINNLEELFINPDLPPRLSSTHFQNESRFNVYPALDVRAGINWELVCLCVSAELEFGYEWLFYYQGIANDRSLSLQGPYLELGIAF